MEQGDTSGTDTCRDSLSFAWDRQESAKTLRAKLAEASPNRWLVLASWIMREARVDEVWEFLRTQEISEHFDALAPRLGRQRKLWEYLIQTWRELGKL